MHEFGRLAEAELQRAASALGALLRAGDVVLFEGEMGAGKTTFARALGEGMGLERPEAVSSPTYTIAMTHPGAVELVHLDLFRFGEMSGDEAVQSAAFESLGLPYDELPPPGAALVVEWSELWADPPRSALRIKLTREVDDAATRRVSAAASHGRGRELLDAWRAALSADPLT